MLRAGKRTIKNNRHVIIVLLGQNVRVGFRSVRNSSKSIRTFLCYLPKPKINICYHPHDHCYITGSDIICNIIVLMSMLVLMSDTCVSPPLTHMWPPLCLIRHRCIWERSRCVKHRNPCLVRSGCPIIQHKLIIRWMYSLSAFLEAQANKSSSRALLMRVCWAYNSAPVPQ